MNYLIHNSVEKTLVEAENAPDLEAARKMVASEYTMKEFMKTFLDSWYEHNKKIVMDAIRIPLSSYK